MLSGRGVRSSRRAPEIFSDVSMLERWPGQGRPPIVERHQLDREQGIHDSRVEQGVVGTQRRHRDRAQDKLSDGLFDVFRRIQGRLRGSRSHVLYLRINMKTPAGLPSQMA